GTVPGEGLGDVLPRHDHQVGRQDRLQGLAVDERPALPRVIHRLPVADRARSLAVPPVGADPEDLLAHDPRVDVPDTLPDAAPPTGLADLELGVAQAQPGRVLDVPPGDLDADDVRRLARLEPGEVGVQPRLRPDVIDGRRS